MSEELGLIVAVCAVLTIIVFALFAVKSAGTARSAFYAIAACAASTMFVFQTILNVCGSMINYSNADYDAAFNKAVASTDDAEQTELYKQCETILAQDAANVYIQDLADMHKGKIVETGTANEVFYHPQDDYTKRLIAAIPTRDRKII